MFSKVRDRLRRQERWTPEELAEELWAMFSPHTPLEHSGPITLYAQTGAPLIIKNAQPDDSIIRVVNKDSNSQEDFSLYATPQDVNPNGPYQGVVTASEGGAVYTVSIFPISASDPSEDVSVTLMSGSVEIGQSVIVSKDADGNYFMLGTQSQRLHVPIHIGLSDAWTLPLAATEFLGLGHYRQKVNLVPFVEGRVVARVINAGIPGTVLRLQYSDDDEVSFSNVPDCDVNIATTGFKTGAWTILPAAVKADVILRIVGQGGNGTDDVRFSTVSVQFR